MYNQVTRAYLEGEEEKIHALLTLTPDGSEWSSSRSGHIAIEERCKGTHWEGASWDPKQAWMSKRIKNRCLLLRMNDMTLSVY